MRHFRRAVVCLFIVLCAPCVRAQAHIDEIPVLQFRVEPAVQSEPAVGSDEKFMVDIALHYNDVTCPIRDDNKSYTLDDLRELILSECRDSFPSSDQHLNVKPAVGGDGRTSLYVEVVGIQPEDHFQITGGLTRLGETHTSVKFGSHPGFRLLQNTDNNYSITVEKDDLHFTTLNLQDQSWLLHPYENPVFVVTVEHQDCDPTKRPLNPYATTCIEQFLVQRTRRGHFDELRVIMLVQTPAKESKLLVHRERMDEDISYAVNGSATISRDVDSLSIPSEQNGDMWHVNWFKKPAGCRDYNNNDNEHGHVEIYQPIDNATLAAAKSNYISVSSAKVFDVTVLQQMLNSTVAQLAQISGFSSASIVGAFGNLQGIARDTQFLAAQATTTPTPGISSTLTNGITGTSQLVNTLTGPTQSTTTVLLQCPDGTIPSNSSGTALTCTAPSSVGPTPPSGLGAITTTTTNAPSSTAQQTTGTQTNQQNQVTTTTPSIVGTVPTAPTSTALAPPTNVGVSSGDILTEQVELNAQITSLRLLLLGALSDQYVIKHGRPVATRRQTTLGFTISLDPPRQYRHAAAEVRVMLVPDDPAADGFSIVNLLPAEKTYNVARVTSKQNAFGAGAAVAPVSVGVSTGKSKDRLYLVKDSDTVALQYTPPVSSLGSVGRPFPQEVHDVTKGLISFMGAGGLGKCGDPGPKSQLDPNLIVGRNATVFGWQFRPVLGAEYVRSGQRQVFAQLAMPPDALDDMIHAKLYIETRWRAYDPKRQVVGADFTASCSVITDLSGVSFNPKPEVKEVEMADLGGGQLRLTASGQFDAPSFSVLAGTVNLAPVTSFGERLLLTANARDLMAADNLTLYGSNGSQPTPFAQKLKADDCCRPGSATLEAIPYPDGNSRMELKLTLGRKYNPAEKADGLPYPLVMIGTQVYGLKETPFEETPLNASDSYLGTTVLGIRMQNPLIATHGNGTWRCPKQSRAPRWSRVQPGCGFRIVWL